MTYKVRVLTRWDGFCASCHHDARPLVLTLAGPAGLRSWLSGDDWEDRALLLTCRVCGGGQDVPWDEDDDVDPPDTWIDLDAVFAPAPAPVLSGPEPLHDPATSPQEPSRSTAQPQALPPHPTVAGPPVEASAPAELRRSA